MEFKYEEIKNIILKNIPSVGNYPTSIKGLRIACRDQKTSFLKCFYEPTCILVLQGLKNMLYGDKNIAYKKGQYVISCTDIPVSSRIVEASSDEPFVALILELDSNIISNLILETKLPKKNEFGEKAIGISDVDEDLLDAFYRLAQLLQKPETEQQILSPIIIKEIYYRLLSGSLGSQLRLINTKGTCSNQIANAISMLKENYLEKLNMEEVAKSVNMAPSSFYRHFKRVTQVSPLQYQKQLKLYEAQRLMLSGNYDAASASYKVGYESPTQFSREYKKMFGNSPKADVKKLIAI